MKLELKHIAPYFPYGLQVNHFDAERERQSICGIVELREDEVTLVNSDYEYYERIEDIKPFLVPLSQLTENLVNNEIPTQLIKLCIMNQNHINTYAYDTVCILIKHHFDVFDLIPAGLALIKSTSKPV